jgi:hypothetical protein
MQQPTKTEGNETMTEQNYDSYSMIERRTRQQRQQRNSQVIPWPTRRHNYFYWRRTMFGVCLERPGGLLLFSHKLGRLALYISRYSKNCQGDDIDDPTAKSMDIEFAHLHNGFVAACNPVPPYWLLESIIGVNACATSDGGGGGGYYKMPRFPIWVVVVGC